jgi:hypothetical protein
LASDADLALRAALLQRACIFWRKKLLTFSLTDIARAIQMTTLGPLTDLEQSICGRFLLSKFGCAELTHSEFVAELNALATENQLGRSVIKIVTAPLLWYIRSALAQGKWKSAGRWTMVLLTFHNSRGVASLVVRSLARRFRPVRRHHGAAPSAPML